MTENLESEGGILLATSAHANARGGDGVEAMNVGSKR